ncbi:MAG: hypothetical protein IJ078_02415 [Succinivibrionaceae bacterium]|nr:hypothetical protein [Succinivibrionaceae bacterium]
MENNKEQFDSILSSVYQEQKNRDASSKIRGFLFQDYVAIEYLLKQDVEKVYIECVEDVDVSYNNGNFEIIQVKYYPKSTPKRKNIFKGLFYSFFCLYRQTHTNVMPILLSHNKNEVTKPTANELCDYISELKEEKNIKAEEKCESPENYIADFINNLQIIKKGDDIVSYRKKISTIVFKNYSNYFNDLECDYIEHVLFGHALLFVHERYLERDNSDYQPLPLLKKNFDEHMLRLSSGSESAIVCYLTDIATGEYCEIRKDNNLSDSQVNILEFIHKNTIEWIKRIAETIDGQYRLINTISTEGYDEVSKFKKLKFNERFRCIAECKLQFKNLLDLTFRTKI